jgi:hypothetical protein
MELPKEKERSHASGARDLTRGTGKAVPRGPGLDAYPGSHVTDDPQSRQYRGIPIGVLPVLGICRGDQRGHGRGHPHRYVGERVSGQEEKAVRALVCDDTVALTDALRLRERPRYAPSGVGAMACAADGGRFRSSCGNAATSSSMIACIDTRAVGRRCSSTTGTCR